MSDIEKKIEWPGWETVRMIGRGNFGVVYEIQRDVFGHEEKAALKVISIPQSDSDIEELYDSGYDEASITATFKSHLESIVNEYTLMREMNGAANVVNCDDFRIVPHDDNIGWDIFIKMELLTPLTKALDRQPSDVQVIQIAKDMCSALILCKKYGIIHRDIKPQNIFVSKNGDYKLGDFGIAKTIEKTSGGTKIGTYKYMAPEVYNNQPYNLAADIYSLGLVLHWLLNERRSPFMPLPPAPAVASQEDEARSKRFSGTPIPAPSHGSEELKRIVLKACAYDPKDRYQSAEEMLADLEKLGGERATGSEVPARSEIEKSIMSTEDVKTVGAFTDPPQPKSEPTPKPKKWPVVLGVIAALVLIAAGLYFLPGWEPATCDTPETHKLLKITRGEALGHAYGNWQIIEEASCTAAGVEERVCANDPTHVEQREIPLAEHTWIDATCDKPSTCAVCGAESKGPIGHAWGEPAFTWANDNSSVTAIRICANDGSHVETETVNTTAETKAATCEAAGHTVYTANFSNTAFTTQTKTEAIDALGHAYGAPTYTWAKDNGSVTAKRVCQNDKSHIETETAQTTSEVTSAATCTSKGKTTYTAVFSNTAFARQKKTVENIAALGHSWKEATYTSPKTCERCGAQEGDTLEKLIRSANVIIRHPADLTVCTDDTAVFSVVASGDVKSYRWQHCRDEVTWMNITASSCPSATTDTLHFAAQDAHDGSQYRCIVSFADGSNLISQPARITIEHVNNSLQSAAENYSSQSASRVNTVVPGKLTIAIAPDCHPYAYLVQGADGSVTLKGIDADIAAFIADEIGLTCDIQYMEYGAIQGAIISGGIDLGISAFPIDGTYDKQIAISIGYGIDNSSVILINKQNTNLISLVNSALEKAIKEGIALSSLAEAYKDETLKSIVP